MNSDIFRHEFVVSVQSFNFTQVISVIQIINLMISAQHSEALGICISYRYRDDFTLITQQKW